METKGVSNATVISCQETGHSIHILTLAPRLLEELALLHDQTTRLAVLASIGVGRPDQERKKSGSHKAGQEWGIEPRADLLSAQIFRNPLRLGGVALLLAPVLNSYLR